MKPSRPPAGRDVRAYARSTQFRLIIGAIAMLFVVGDGLIWLLYGAGPARLALLCTAGGLVPVIVIAATLWLMEAIVKRAVDD